MGELAVGDLVEGEEVEGEEGGELVVDGELMGGEAEGEAEEGEAEEGEADDEAEEGEAEEGEAEEGEADDEADGEAEEGEEEGITPLSDTELAALVSDAHALPSCSEAGHSLHTLWLGLGRLRKLIQSPLRERRGWRGTCKAEELAELLCFRKGKLAALRYASSAAGSQLRPLACMPSCTVRSAVDTPSIREGVPSPLEVPSAHPHMTHPHMTHPHIRTPQMGVCRRRAFGPRPAPDAYRAVASPLGGGQGHLPPAYSDTACGPRTTGRARAIIYWRWQGRWHGRWTAAAEAATAPV